MLYFTPRELLGQEVHGRDGAVVGTIKAVSLVSDENGSEEIFEDGKPSAPRKARTSIAPEALRPAKKMGRPKLAIARRDDDKVWIKKGKADLQARVTDLVWVEGRIVLKGPARSLETGEL
jgi:sporulation protein YlmC with PRC-barrel domain